MSSSVVSLELAKLLREAGYPQDNQRKYTLWCPNRDAKSIWISPKENYKREYGFDEDGVAAPSVGELLQTFPIDVGDFSTYYKITHRIEDGKSKWVATFYFKEEEMVYCVGESLAYCVGEMWLWLKKEGYLK